MAHLDSALATINIDVDPVLHLGGLAIHWYGIMYAIAFGVALYAGVIPHLEKRGIDRATAERYTTWAIIMGLLGARLYYVVQSSPPQGGSWFSHPEEILAVWHGGMAFFGAVIAAPLTLAVLSWRDKHNFWLLADAGAIFAVVGQPIGRIGNVINGDILGYQSNLPWATAYTNPNALLQCPDPGSVEGCFRLGVPYQPAAVYEALGTLCILGVLFFLRRRYNPRAGVLFIVYIALYCVSQVGIFFTRGSEPTVALGLKQAQWTAIAIGAVGVPLLYMAWRRGLGDWAREGTETGAIASAVTVAEDERAGQEAREEAVLAAEPAPEEDDVLPGSRAEQEALSRRERRRQERAERKQRRAEAFATAGPGEEPEPGGGEAEDVPAR